jgi:hypothetical protein
MLEPQDQLEKDLRNIYADYDQTVDVVSCWQAIVDFILSDHRFFRFGKFKTEIGETLTPDFAIAKTTDNKTASSGALIFDVKKLPNPFPENATENVQKEALARFENATSEVFKYKDVLKYTSEHMGLPKLTFASHDVVLLTPTEVSDNAYNYLKRTLPHPFNIGRPLVLVEYTYNQADNLERYVFKWKLGECNSPFTNPVLRERMIDKGQPLTVYPKRFIPFKIRHITCNDPAPPVYLLAFLWVEVFVKLMTEGQFEEWQQTSSATIIEIDVTIDQLMRKIQDEYDTSINGSDVRRAFDELVMIKRAKLISAEKGQYVIFYSNLAGRALPELEQEGVQKRLELREYGRVFATLLARKQLKRLPPPRTRVGRTRRPKTDYPYLPFGE